ncbi:MAG: type II secretion system GspH family protein [Phycisphaerales bacterium]|nr:type II secretion system GspH family protein [Phycisphaerales bacterium]
MHNQANRNRRGFTLIELLVAIGAIALIAVGIAAVFESVGRTVTGGRRVSLLNQAAAQIEQQLREDFRAMSRDGFLVIRHAYVDVNANGNLTLAGDSVPLHPADLNPRPRRADEIVFLARGRFTSVRDALHPVRSPKGDHARIYIGHGARYDADGSQSEINAFVTPETDHGFPGDPADRWRLGARNGPNEFAAEWMLARHVTLLIQPTGAEQGPPNPDPFGLAPARWLDSDIQIAAQPAASSLFRHLAQFDSPSIPRIRNNAEGLLPLFASGIVDIATTDPAEVRTIICDADILPFNSSPADFDPATGAALDGSFQASPPTGNPLLGDRKFVHAWLRELFPSHSFAGSAGGHRIRVEPSMPAYVDTVALAGQQGWTPEVLAYRLADQRAVTAHGFVPRCTEFIVEFSFGQTVNDDTSPRHGELIWHGLERFVDADGDPNTSNGPFNDGREYRVAAPYPTDPATGAPRDYSTVYRRLDGTTGSYQLYPNTIYDATIPSGGQYPVEQYAHFGYFDPTWQPAAANEPPTIPWAWPTLIRITLSLADAQDPSVEQSYQFVFEVPERRSF